jgi:hypothetical protein
MANNNAIVVQNGADDDDRLARKWASNPKANIMNQTGIPNRSGKVFLLSLSDEASGYILDGDPLSSVFTGDDAGGVNNPNNGNLIVAQHARRLLRAGVMIRSCFLRNSEMYRMLGTDDFEGSGYLMWRYLNGEGVIYIEPQQGEIRADDILFKAISYDNLPSNQKNIEAIQNLAAQLQNSNKTADTVFVKTEDQMVEQLIFALPKQLKAEGCHIYDNVAYATSLGLNVGPLILSHMPSFNGGVNPLFGQPLHNPLFNVDPRGGRLSFNKLLVYFDSKFRTAVKVGTIHLNSLNSLPDVNLLRSAPESETGTNDVPGHMSIEDAWLTGYNLQDNYAYYMDRPLKTCKNCGGIGHFAESKDRKDWICPTPKSSVPWDVLTNIRYPMGVTAWRFPSGKGKGKGKGGRGFGKGKGGGRGGKGGGRGGQPGPSGAYMAIDDSSESMEDTNMEDDTEWNDDE